MPKKPRSKKDKTPSLAQVLISGVLVVLGATGATALFKIGNVNSGNSEVIASNENQSGRNTAQAASAHSNSTVVQQTGTVTNGSLYQVAGDLTLDQSDTNTAEGVKRIEDSQLRMEEKLEAILKKVEAVEYAKRRDFTNEFPLGHIVFTFLGGKPVAPVGELKDFDVDWTPAAVTVTQDATTVRLPNLSFRSQLRGGLTNMVVNLAKHDDYSKQVSFGPVFANIQISDNIMINTHEEAITIGSNPTHTLVVRIVEREEFGNVLVMGLKSYSPTSDRSNGFRQPQGIRIGPIPE